MKNVTQGGNDGQQAAYATLHIINHLHIVLGERRWQQHKDVREDEKRRKTKKEEEEGGGGGVEAKEEG